MRIDINLLFPLGRRYGSPPTSKLTCVRCGYADHVCHCHFTDDLSIELDMRLARRTHGLPDMAYR